jgi:4-diphosphocytidyl-2-C-methyl-D-erythritol kinase
VLTEFAPAKINLCLHVTGRRDDRYHLLDSLVVFGSIGDRLHATRATELSLTIGGAFGAGLGAGSDNLVLRAAQALASRLGRPPGARLHLEKDLPIASGIGGGSADAAAALRVLADLWDLAPAERALMPEIAVELGADVLVCLNSCPARMRGIGEEIDSVTLPLLHMVLVNPGVPVPTAAVFEALALLPGATGSQPLRPQSWTQASCLLVWLANTHNDLQAAAIGLCPQIAAVLDALLATSGCRFARMSGSGATCFGVYESAAEAETAASSLAASGWWARAGRSWRVRPAFG